MRSTPAKKAKNPLKLAMLLTLGMASAPLTGCDAGAVMGIVQQVLPIVTQLAGSMGGGQQGGGAAGGGQQGGGLSSLSGLAGSFMSQGGGTQTTASNQGAGANQTGANGSNTIFGMNTNGQTGGTQTASTQVRPYLGSAQGGEDDGISLSGDNAS